MFYAVENIPDEQTMQAVVAELLPLVPCVRRDKALQYKHLHGRYCCLRAWQLLHELLVRHAFLPASFPLADLTYTHDAYGKPAFTEAVFAQLAQQSFSTEVCFSLSHTRNAIAVAVSRRPVGIDVEALVSLKRAEDAPLLQRTMSAAEQARIAGASDPCMAFTELWTQKEALYKAVGTGISFDTLPTVLQQPHPYTFLTAHTPVYALTVAYAALPEDVTLQVRPFAELSTAELYEILKARFSVFVCEQKIWYLDEDDIDLRATHFSLCRQGRVIAYARLFADSRPDVWCVGRMLTVERGKGLGLYLMQRMVAEAQRRGATLLRLHAQTHAVPFYERCGFHTVGDTFIEAEIPHIMMERTL